MNHHEFEVLGRHAVGIMIAAELLAQASRNASIDDWLALISAESASRYESMSPEELKQLLDRLEDAMFIRVPCFEVSPDQPAAEPSRFAAVNEDDPNKPGVGDAI